MRTDLAGLGMVALLAIGCTDTALKRQGESCFASSECEAGLVCDLGGSNQCQMQGTGGGTPDAGNPNQPDGAPGQPDAAPGTPDAAPGTPDGSPALPDAALPDAAI